jgi:KTSC domain
LPESRLILNRQPIESKTGMCGIGFDPATETLEIEFKSRKPDQPNTLYQYTPVSQADYDAFMAAESKGSHFIKVIKPGFACKKLGPVKPEEESSAATQG